MTIPSQGNFWTPASKAAFHQNVENLFRKTRKPCEQEIYRGQPLQESEHYALLQAEERHLADHVAFLAQEHGNLGVSATTIEELPERPGLKFVVAANETPSKRIEDGLKDIFQILSAYARGDIRRHTCETDMFDRVCNLSKTRIHQRLSGKRLRKRFPSSLRALSRRVRGKLEILQGMRVRHSRDWGDLLAKIEDLADCYEKAENWNLDSEMVLLKTAVRRSFEVSTSGSDGSLENRIRSFNLNHPIWECGEILEIDKLGRYFALCVDFIEISRRPRCRPLFGDISVHICTSPHPVKPIGAEQLCRTHGETQLVLYYEQHPICPTPRAIGSSKSACFLCDLFVKHHGKFCISHSHKHLYNQWMIPDVEWMTPPQIEKFSQVIQAMTDELIRLRKSYKSRPNINGLESRAHLPYYPTRSVSPCSTVSLHSGQSQHDLVSTVFPAKRLALASMSIIDEIAPGKLENENLSGSSLDLGSHGLTDLPLVYELSIMIPPLSLVIDGISLVFEFLRVAKGRVEIIRVPEVMDLHKFGDCRHQVELTTLPINDGIDVQCDENQDDLNLLIKY